MDLLLLRMQERFPGLKSSVEHNTFQAKAKAGGAVNSVIQAHSTDRWFS